MESNVSKTHRHAVRFLGFFSSLAHVRTCAREYKKHTKRMIVQNMCIFVCINNILFKCKNIIACSTLHYFFSLLFFFVFFFPSLQFTHSFVYFIFVVVAFVLFSSNWIEYTWLTITSLTRSAHHTSSSVWLCVCMNTWK